MEIYFYIKSEVYFFISFYMKSEPLRLWLCNRRTDAA